MLVIQFCLEMIFFSDCGSIKADEHCFRGHDVTLRFRYTDSQPCHHFRWKMYTDDWIDISAGVKFQMLDEGRSKVLIILNSSDTDVRNYAIECCDKSFSNIVSLKLTGNVLYR